MSLMKKRRVTEESLAAHRRNAQMSTGPVTAEGRERMRAAHRRHGRCSAADEAALQALGEDPEDFRQLMAGIEGKSTALDTLQRRLARPLARALARMERADRMQEGQALRQAKAEGNGRENRLHAQMMLTRMTEDSLRGLFADVQNPYFVATPEHLKQIKSLRQEVVLKEMGDIIVALFYMLREPGTPDMGEPGEGEDPQVQQRKVLQRIKEIFGVGCNEPPEAHGAAGSAAPEPEAASAASPLGPVGDVNGEAPPAPPAAPAGPPARYRNITPEEWESREPVRQILENILRRQVELCVAHHDQLLKELINGPTLHERAAEIAPVLTNTQHMQRLEDANFRRATRLTNLLIRLRRLEEQTLENQERTIRKSNRNER